MIKRKKNNKVRISLSYIIYGSANKRNPFCDFDRGSNKIRRKRKM